MEEIASPRTPQRSTRGHSKGARDQSTRTGKSQEEVVPLPSRFFNWRRAAGSAFATALLLWAAFPPLGLSLLAWGAPVGLLRLIDRDEPPKRGGYVAIWMAGCLFWLAILQGIRLAFWPLTFGWIALSLYLAVYWPLMVGIARILRHRWRWPLVLAAPVAWTGTELARSYMITGFAANTLAHSQYRQPMVLQIADQLSGYAVGFVIMSCAVALLRVAQLVRNRYQARYGAESDAASRARPSVFEIAWPCMLLAATLSYGAWRLNESDALAAISKPLLRAALVQENTPSVYNSNREQLQEAWERYLEMTALVIQREGPVDLVVWPESTFTGAEPWMEDSTTTGVPKELAQLGYDRQAIGELVERYTQVFERKVSLVHDTVRGAMGSRADPAARAPYLIVGNDVLSFTNQGREVFNAAFLVGPDGKVADRYEKIHLVMFGEYIPFADWFSSTFAELGLPMTQPGEGARVFSVNDVQIAPNICFESTLPHFVAWQMRQLARAGHSPDVLVTITNDSWFRGSSLLDHHLASEVLVAIEMRRPLLVAANTGLSAWIDGAGRIKQVTPRLEKAYIVAECSRDSRFGLTQVWADLPAWCMAIVCLVALVSPRLQRKRDSYASSAPTAEDSVRSDSVVG